MSLAVPEAGQEQVKKLKPLSKKQQAFVEHYLQCWNASRAARLAGYSERTAGSIGSENLKKPEIEAAIKARLSEMTMQSDEVLVRLTEQARGIDSRYFTVSKVSGEVVIDFDHLLADGRGHLIKALGYSKDGDLTRVEFYDAQAALVQIGRHYKLFTDAVDLTSGGKRIEVTEIRLHEPKQPNNDD